MKFFAVLFALVAAASATGILPPVLLNKVNVAPTQVNVVRQPIHVTQAEPVLRHVPVPVRAVAYTNPAVITPVVAAAPVHVPVLQHQAIVSPYHHHALW